jgi:pyruvate ferredoxin oxidoreductase beta subunit
MGTGTVMCAGCGGLEAIHEAYNLLGHKTIFINAAGCMTMLAAYPYTPFPGSWLYTAMAAAPAAAQGVRDALDICIDKGRVSKENDLTPVVLTGDGVANGIGLNATSGALDRHLDFIYLCYDNEGYGNTGQQYSAATPYAAKTSTSSGPKGYSGVKKDLFAIWMAHKPAYLATVIGAEPLDLARKISKALQIKGPRLILALAPCPTGWGFAPSETVNIGKLAVQTGIWPLKEFYDGHLVHTKIPKQRLPAEEYLKTQTRFAHLFSPTLQCDQLTRIQNHVDSYWQRFENK